jgi:hypothetical protein
MDRHRCRPVDLQVLASAVAGDVLASPGRACELFGIPWPERVGDPDRLRAEAGSLVQLYRVLVAELDRLAPGLAPDRVFSTGSLVTWAFERARVRPLGEMAEDIDPFFLGEMASAFYGGRIEARMPGVVTSMALADISKTYASILSVGGLGRFYGAERFGIEVVEPAELRELLRSRAWRYDSTAWVDLSTLFATVWPHG